MENISRKVAWLEEEAVTEMLPGVMRTTLAYNPQMMLCHFNLKKGASIPLHNHPAAQAGYVISGSVRFFTKEGRDFKASAGSAYVFDPMELHGSEVLEDTVFIECFSPMRPEYIKK